MSESVEVYAERPDPPGADDCICRTYWEVIRRWDGVRRLGCCNQFIGYLLALNVCGAIDDQEYLELRLRIREISDQTRREMGV